MENKFFNEVQKIVKNTACKELKMTISCEVPKVGKTCVCIKFDKDAQERFWFGKFETGLVQNVSKLSKDVCVVETDENLYIMRLIDQKNEVFEDNLFIVIQETPEVNASLFGYKVTYVDEKIDFIPVGINNVESCEFFEGMFWICSNQANVLAFPLK